MLWLMWQAGYGIRGERNRLFDLSLYLDLLKMCKVLNRVQLEMCRAHLVQKTQVSKLVHDCYTKMSLVPKNLCISITAFRSLCTSEVLYFYDQLAQKMVHHREFYPPGLVSAQAERTWGGALLEAILGLIGGAN